MKKINTPNNNYSELTKHVDALPPKGYLCVGTLHTTLVRQNQLHIVCVVILIKNTSPP